jgi:hypothetical protein
MPDWLIYALVGGIAGGLAAFIGIKAMQRPSGRLSAIFNVVLIVFGIWPITLSLRSGDWATAALLVVLAAGVVVVWVVGERRRAAVRRQMPETDQEP